MDLRRYERWILAKEKGRKKERLNKKLGTKFGQIQITEGCEQSLQSS